MKVRTAADAIDILGGHRKVADLLELDSRVVSNWIMRGSFPASLHWSIGPVLRGMGHSYDPTELFRQFRLPKRARDHYQELA